MAKIGQAPNYTGIPGITITVAQIEATDANLNDLSDVTAPSPVEGDTIRRRSGIWRNEALPGGQSAVLADGTYGDVTVSATGTNFQVGNNSHTHDVSTVTPAGIGAAVTAHTHTGTYQPLDTAIRVYIPAAAMWATTTSGCSGPLLLETTTNKVNRVVLSFPAGSTSRAEFEYDTPSNWDAGTLTVAFKWETPGVTTDSSTFAVTCRSYGDGDPIDAALTGGSKSVSDAASGSAGDMRITDATAALTPQGTRAAGETLHFRISITAHANTTVYLHGVYLTLTHT